MDIKHDIEEIKHDSWAMEILKDYKSANKRMFVILLITLIMWFVTIGYLVFVLNDISYTEETIDIQEVEQIEGSNIQIGDK